jgi:hypothetical protein
MMVITCNTLLFNDLIVHNRADKPSLAGPGIATVTDDWRTLTSGPLDQVLLSPASSLPTMRSLKLSQSKTTPGAASTTRQMAAPTADSDPLARADRLFGGPAHLVLLSDNGPALSFMGWTLGSSRAESVDEQGQNSRVVEVEIMFSEEGNYVVFERFETQLADSGPLLVTNAAAFPAPRDVCRYCETATQDPQADAARAAAVDHAARQWHWLKRPGRRGGEKLELPFAI